MNKWHIANLAAVFLCSVMGCHAQLPYDKFRESLLQYDYSVAEFVIDASVHAYYKQYYRLPNNYDDLLQFVPRDDHEYLVTACDSLFYKNRELITFIPNPDSSALLYSGKIVFGLYSQYTCKILLETPVQIGVHMVDTEGRCYHDDNVVLVIKKQILPTVYRMAQELNCKKHYRTFESNMIPCSIPYQYDVDNKSLSMVEDCRRISVTTCSEFDSILETEFKKYDFDGIKIITFPVNLYLDD